jgi:hypothetical protein
MVSGDVEPKDGIVGWVGGWVAVESSRAFLCRPSAVNVNAAVAMLLLPGMLLCLARDLLPKKYGRFVPSPMAMGLPFYIGAASVSPNMYLR